MTSLHLDGEIFVPAFNQANKWFTTWVPSARQGYSDLLPLLFWVLSDAFRRCWKRDEFWFQLLLPPGQVGHLGCGIPQALRNTALEERKMQVWRENRFLLTCVPVTGTPPPLPFSCLMAQVCVCSLIPVPLAHGNLDPAVQTNLLHSEYITQLRVRRMPRIRMVKKLNCDELYSGRKHLVWQHLWPETQE